MTIHSAVEQAQYRWMERRLRDKKLDDAWAKVYHMMFAGSRQSLEAGVEIILEMDWLDALSRFVEVNDHSELIVSAKFSSQDQSVIAYALLLCLEKSDSEYWLASLEPQELDLLFMFSAGMETLYEIPDWMVEPLFLASIATKRLPADSYSIGHAGKSAFEDERLQSVSIEQIEIGRFPVSQFLYNIIMNDNPSQSLGWNHPVDTVSWVDAIQFCNRLSEAVELEPVYTLGHTLQINETATGFRLPTTSEWEAAARYQSALPFAGSDKLSDVAWRNMQSSQPIARLQSNTLGLFDMCGSVWQWCQDHDQDYAKRKGGSWLSEARACEIWFQSKRRTQYTSVAQGFRICRKSIEEQKEEAPPPSQTKWDDDSWGQDDW